MKQTLLYRSAVLIHALNSLYSVVFAFPALMQGPSTQGVADGVPQFVIVSAALLGMAGLVSAYGAWYGQQWGIWLTLVTEALNGLLALPGVLFAPTPFARISSVVGVLIALLVIIVLLYRPKTALA